jgi:hypothetical protein
MALEAEGLHTPMIGDEAFSLRARKE